MAELIFLRKSLERLLGLLLFLHHRKWLDFWTAQPLVKTKYKSEYNMSSLALTKTLLAKEGVF